MSRIFRASVVLAIAAAVFAASTLARPQHARRSADGMPTTYLLPGAHLFPEGMGYDRRTGDYFVGAIGDGSVLRGNVNQASATVFSPAGGDGRTAALGARPDHGRVFVGSFAGSVWVYDEASGKLLARLATMPKSITNDFSFLPDGTAFVTDSVNPYLWRMTTRGGRLAIDRWLDFNGTAFVYRPGFNADGIVTSPDGRYLILNAINTGKLFRIDVASKAVTEIMKTGGGPFALRNADGMDLVGQTLYIARNRNQQITKLRLAGDFASGALVSVTRGAFQFPTSVIAVGNRMLVLRSQLDKFIAKKPPVPPFTILDIPLP